MRAPSVLFLALSACGGPEMAIEQAPEIVALKTTDGALATRRLDLDIADAERRFERTGGEWGARLVSLLLLRARAFGSYTDLDRAAALAATVPAAASEVDSARHRFEDVLTRSPQGPSADAARIAVGRAEEVVDGLVAEASAHQRLSDQVLAAAALSELGDIEGADAQYLAALRSYRDVSPFIVAELYFRRGVLWAEIAGRSDWGRQMYEQGLEHLPGHVTMSVHLAEIEAENGEVQRAQARLEALLEAGTEDPEPHVRLAELTRAEASQAHVTEARRIYTSLLERHPEAFWDHASEFYREAGADPDLALQLAQLNLQARVTDRALGLAVAAAVAADRADVGCALVRDYPRTPKRASTREALAELQCN